MPLVGRTHERDTIAAALADLRAGAGGVLLLEGEPGIGKSRLLGFVAESAEGCTVLEARASEYEADLPLALFTEALDRHLAEIRLDRLGLADPEALAAALPALGVPPVPADRHRLHRALRDLLERLAATRPLVLCLDDLHWADPASVDALAALVRRPPSAPVLLALAARENRVPAPLAAVPALKLAPLTQAEAAELVGADLYAQAGGNPFYLEQLARLRDAAVPRTVAAAVAAELAGLPPEARTLLDAAAVAGDPFELGLAAAVAEQAEPDALHALDELLLGALVRPTEAPRRFAFRHPVVRHAVYDAIPGGRRLGAHARAAAELERRGAGPVERAHHVEHAATPGDAAAIAVLETAAERLQALAPAAAARYQAAVLRLLPEPDARLSIRLADAQAAAGDAAAARATLHGALRTASAGDRLALTVALANQEWWLGDHEDARRWLHVVLGDLPAAASPDRIRLRLALSLTALLACDLSDARDHAADARDDARAIGDPVFEFAALAAIAVAAASAGVDELAGSEAALERLTPQQLAVRLPGLWMRGRAQRALGRPAAALAELERGAALAAETGRERVLLMCTIESAAALVELGRIADAIAAAEEGLERARLAGNPRMLLWAHANLSTARLAAGEVSAALEQAEAAAALGTRADFHAAGQPGWCLGAALDRCRQPGPRRRRASPSAAARPPRRPRRPPPPTSPTRSSRRRRAGRDSRRGGHARRPDRARPRARARASTARGRRGGSAPPRAAAARSRPRARSPRAARWPRRAPRRGDRGARGRGGGARRLRRAPPPRRGRARAAAARPPGGARRARADGETRSPARARDRRPRRRRAHEPRGRGAARAQHAHGRGPPAHIYAKLGVRSRVELARRLPSEPEGPRSWPA